MRCVLIHMNLWSYVDGSIVKVEGEANTAANVAWKIKDAKALALITLNIKTSHIIHIKECNTSKSAWDKLEQLYPPTGPARKVTLFKELNLLKVNEGQSIKNRVSSFSNIVNKLSEIE